MSALSVESFLSNLRKMPKEPAGKLERSEALKIQTRTGTSDGKKTSRLCLDELNEDCFRVAACVGSCFLCGEYYGATQIKIDGHSETIWVNIKSMMKRFDLPRDVILSNLVSNFGKIVRLVQEKRLFQAEEIPFSNGEDVGVPLLPIRNQFPSLIPLKRIAKMANEQDRCFRLSKRCYHLAKSIDVHPGGFIAIDTGKLLGEGNNARVKVSTTFQGVKVARRVVVFDLNNLNHQAWILRMMKIFTEFRSKTGILDTLAMGVYENKKEQCKFVSFHPLYDQSLSKAYKKPPEKDRLKMAHQLLKGFNIIAEKGLHNDLAHRNIFVRATQGFEAVIGDLEFFQYHEEGMGRIVNPILGSQRMKQEVWSLGCMLYYVLQASFQRLPWESSRHKKKITQERLDKALSSCHFSLKVEALLRGMLALDPNARWTAKQSLEYFEANLLSIQD